LDRNLEPILTQSQAIEILRLIDQFIQQQAQTIHKQIKWKHK